WNVVRSFMSVPCDERDRLRPGLSRISFRLSAGERSVAGESGNDAGDNLPQDSGGRGGSPQAVRAGTGATGSSPGGAWLWRRVGGYLAPVNGAQALTAQRRQRY